MRELKKLEQSKVIRGGGRERTRESKTEDIIRRTRTERVRVFTERGQKSN